MQAEIQQVHFCLLNESAHVHAFSDSIFFL